MLPAIAALCLFSTALAGVIGPAIPYEAPVAANSAPAPQPPPPAVRATSASEIREMLYYNARVIALGTAAVLAVGTFAACAFASDSCVQRRANFNRRIPIAVRETAPH